MELFRHRFSVALIFSIHLMSESRLLKIKGYQYAAWFFPGIYAEKYIEKSIYGIGMKSFGISKVRNAIEGTIYNAVSVY